MPVHLSRAMVPLAAAGATLALLSMAIPSAAQELPRRKSGLWELKGDTMPAMSQCVDQASDQALLGTANKMQAANCSKTDIRRESGNRMVTNSVCKMGGSTVTTRAVVTGDFETNYKIETESRYDPPLGGRSQDKATLQARWVGPCKPGMKPGDMVMPGGQVISGDMMRKMHESMRK